MDIKKLIADLKSAGWSQTAIAKHVGCSQPLLAYYIRTGTEPRYSVGAKLVELHRMETFRAELDAAVAAGAG